jgi:sRNA-binding protein
VSKSDKRAVHTIHAMLMERFPLAFPQDYDAIRPLKVGILADVIERMPGFDPVVLRRVLANHTRRDGYLLALLHHRGDRRYDLDGQPVGTVTVDERAEAARLLAASTQRGQTKAARVRVHQEREEKRQKQREMERRNREAKTARKAEHERIQQEIAARKAALIAQGITPESRAERKRRLAQASRTGFRPPTTPKPALDRPAVPPAPRPERPPDRADSAPAPRPERLPDRADPAPAPSMPHVEFRKKRRIVPPDQKGPA